MTELNMSVQSSKPMHIELENIDGWQGKYDLKNNNQGQILTRDRTLS